MNPLGAALAESFQGLKHFQDFKRPATGCVFENPNTFFETQNILSLPKKKRKRGQMNPLGAPFEDSLEAIIKSIQHFKKYFLQSCFLNPKNSFLHQ